VNDHRNVSTRFEAALNWFLQAGYSTAFLFLKNQLSSHASGVAYYFLLAVGPLVLVVISILNTSLVNYPELTKDLFALLEKFSEQLSEEFFRNIGVLETQVALSGLSLLGLLWTSRLIVSAVQSAFGVIFPSPRARNPLWSNLLSLVLLPVILTLLGLSAASNVAVRFLRDEVEHYPWLENFYDLLLSLSGSVAPMLLIFSLIFLCYRFLPLERPRTWHAALGAGLCTLAILGLKIAFVHFVSLATYNYVYGSLGAVLFLLLWVYLIFFVFYLCAQFVEVAGRIDTIALDRIIALQDSEGGVGERLEHWLFGRSRRIFSRYVRQIPAGGWVYHAGDEEQQIFYLQRGTVEIIPSSDSVETVPIATILPGQFFGEMAYLVKEPRLASARVREETELLIIPPSVFEELLVQSPAISRKIIDSMGQRLQQCTNLLARAARNTGAAGSEPTR
jgi:membrane protein